MYVFSPQLFLVILSNSGLIVDLFLAFVKEAELAESDRIKRGLKRGIEGRKTLLGPLLDLL
jgi:hypothetical protein